MVIPLRVVLDLERGNVYLVERKLNEDSRIGVVVGIFDSTAVIVRGVSGISLCFRIGSLIL